jgi:hypothetical protein
MISEELRASYLIAADACRYAAEQGWRPSHGALVTNHHNPTEWSCCALGALAIKREVEGDSYWSDFAEALEFVADLPLSMALGDAGGRQAAMGVAYAFDQVAEVWDECVRGCYAPADHYSRWDRQLLRELNHTHESMAKLSPPELWLLAAKRFEQLAN